MPSIRVLPSIGLSNTQPDCSGCAAQQHNCGVQQGWVVLVAALGGVACGHHGERDFDITFSHGGLERTAWVHLPEPPANGAPRPLLLVFHGYGTTAGEQEKRSGMNDAAAARGFVTVHPSGAWQSWNAGGCCGRAQARHVDDVGFVDVLLTRLGQRINVDPRRVFLLGMSNGGFLAYRLGCERAQQFAAMVVVAGLNVTRDCSPSRPVPLLHLHGTKDPLVPYQGRPISGFMRVRDSVHNWPGRAECPATWTVLSTAGDTACELLPACNGGAEATLCTIAQGGHNWPGEEDEPGLGHVSHDISATQMALDFFEANPQR